MDDSFKKLIDSASSILILLPVKPYYDQVAAGLSLYLSMLGKKDVSISCPTPMLVEFNRLVGVNKINNQPGNKNLIISLGNYQATNIERVSYDIENQEFKLTIIPKTGMTPPSRDQVKLSFAGISADLVLLIGGATLQQFPLVNEKELVGVKLAHIGVKQLSDEKSKDILSFAQSSSSVSEIIATYIKAMGYEYDQDIATNLLSGIENASRGFTSDFVTADTFQTISNLMRSGGKRGRISVKNVPPGAQPAEIFDKPKIQAQTNFEEKNKGEKPPQDWLSPKIYKGTSVS